MPSSPEAKPDASRPRARVLGAFLEGWRRVLHAPALAAGVWVFTMAAAVPLAITVGRLVESQLGSSLEARRLLGGWSTIWEDEFQRGATGAGRTLTHEMLGFGGTMATLSRFADAVPLDPALAGAVAFYIAAWVVLSGGVLTRLARGRPIGAAPFFAACAAYTLRFVRLAIVVAPVYWALFRWVHPLLFERLYDRLTRDLAAEHQVVIVRVALYLVFFLALAAVNVLADFAKVRSVVEDRRSMPGALVAAGRFVRRRAARVAALYLLNVVAFFVIVRLWLQIAPVAGAPTWIAFAAAELFLAARVLAKLAFMASEVAFFQGELGRAGYVAPRAAWRRPDADTPAASSGRTTTAVATRAR